MKIFTKVVSEWNGFRYVVTHIEAEDYDGPISLCCGASGQQTSTFNQQTQLSQQMMSQAGTIFGNSSQVFNDLVNSLSPTVAEGPNQKGFSSAEESALNSAAITNSGVAARNAKSATGDAMAAQNGGNVSSTASGTTAGVDANINASAAENTADQLNKINQENYAVGRQNYDTALSDLEGSTSVFNPATSAGSAASSALEGQANTANQIAQEDNSWVQGVTGALGGVAGAAAGGYFKTLGSGGK